MTVEAEPDDGSATRRGRALFRSRGYEIACLLELIALTSIAIAQPILSVFGNDVGSLVPLHLSFTDVVEFLVLLTFVPALVLWLGEVLIGLAVPRAREAVHCLILGALLGSAALDAVKHVTSFGVNKLVLIGAVVGVAGAVILYVSKIMREWVRWTSIAPILIVSLFLFGTPAHGLVFGSQPKAAAVTVTKPARVVEIVMDEFPEESLLDGHGGIDATLFPNFSALSQTATWYPNTTAVAPNTVRAVPAILSGNMPKNGEIPAASDFPHSMFTLLGGTYSMDVHESATRLCPDNLCHQKYGGTKVCPDAVCHQSYSGESGLSGVISTAVTAWTKLASPQRKKSTVDIAVSHDAIDNGLALLEGIQPSAKPVFDMVHVLLPHEPWHYLSGGRDTGYDAAVDAHANWATTVAATLNRQRHLMQLQAADWFLGQVVARLKAIGAYDQTLIVVTADHGIAFTAGQPIRGFSKKNYDQILWVPLLIKAPDQTRGVRDDKPVLTIDVLPTVADMLGIKLPWTVDGQSALGPRRSEGPRPIVGWSWSTVSPAKGAKFVYFDGAAGFAKVLKRSAWNPDARADARLYGAGPFAALVGRTPDPRWIDQKAKLGGTLTSPASFSHVNPRASTLPWLHIPGHVSSLKAGSDVAIVVNGVIAALSPVSPKTKGFSAFAIPDAFVPGKNQVAVYAVSGTVENPRLVAVELAAGAA